jgi:hypothetical protein
MERKDYERNDMLEKKRYFLKFTCWKKNLFLWCRATKADDYYIDYRVKNSLKKTDRFTSKHKIYLYKEDFSAFAEILGDMTAYVLNHKGEE